jgi:hypothetical protein
MSTDFSTALMQLERAGDRPEHFSMPFVDFLPVTGAAVSTLGDLLGNETLSATDARAARLDEVQFDLGEGPCWDALRSAQPVAATSLDSDGRGRWPHFFNAIAAESISSLFAFPLLVGPLRIGAVDLYSHRPTTLTHDDEVRASALAYVVSRHILRVAIGEAPEDADNRPLSRRVVHHATGIVLAQLDISADDARLVLQGQAYAAGKPMTDVAEDVVAGRMRFRRTGDIFEVES